MVPRHKTVGRFVHPLLLQVAALEEYMKTHPSKEEDKIALRKRARELSASIGSGQVRCPRSGQREQRALPSGHPACMQSRL